MWPEIPGGLSQSNYVKTIQNSADIKAMKRMPAYRPASFFAWALTTTLMLGSAFAQDAPKKVTKKEANSAVITRVSPDWPAVAKQLRLMGNIELEAVVSADGTVEKVTIVSGNPVLTRPAAEALKKWMFTPFTVEGKAVRAVVPVSLSFGM
jgi:protein TonB